MKPSPKANKLNRYIEQELISEQEQFPQSKDDLILRLQLQLISLDKCTIHDDLSVSVDGSVNLMNKNLTYLPIKFKKVKGDFLCRKNQLITLRGSPIEVTGNFDCSNNNITSLRWAPKYVYLSFIASHNKITKITTDCPIDKVSGSFQLDHNLLTKIEYLPKNTKSINFNGNNLTKFESVNLPTVYKESIDHIEISGNKFTSLESLAQFSGCQTIWCSFNKIKSTDDFPIFSNLIHLEISNNKLETFTNHFSPNLKKLNLNFNFINKINTESLNNLEILWLLDERPHTIDYPHLLNLNQNTELYLNYDHIEDEDLRIKICEYFCDSSLPLILKSPSINKIPKDQWKQKLLDDVIFPLKKKRIILDHL